MTAIKALLIAGLITLGLFLIIMWIIPILFFVIIFTLTAIIAYVLISEDKKTSRPP